MILPRIRDVMLIALRSFSKRNISLLIGDSHAVAIHSALNHEFTKKLTPSYYLERLGPRLMYSISKKGFLLRERTIRKLKLMRFDRVYVIVGEIDCRVYLSDESLPYAKDSIWVRDFLKECDELRRELEVSELVMVGPPPPSDIDFEYSQYPRAGSISARVNATKWLSETLQNEIALHYEGKVRFIEIWSQVTNRDSTLDPNFTDDGVHINLHSASKISGYFE